MSVLCSINYNTQAHGHNHLFFMRDPDAGHVTYTLHNISLPTKRSVTVKRKLNKIMNDNIQIDEKSLKRKLFLKQKGQL